PYTTLFRFHLHLVSHEVAGLVVAHAIPVGGAVAGQIIDRIGLGFGLHEPMSHGDRLWHGAGWERHAVAWESWKKSGTTASSIRRWSQSSGAGSPTGSAPIPPGRRRPGRWRRWSGGTRSGTKIPTGTRRTRMSEISRFRVASLDELPDDLRNRIEPIAERTGFVPNVFLGMTHRPDELRAFMDFHDAL